MPSRDAPDAPRPPQRRAGRAGSGRARRGARGGAAPSGLEEAAPARRRGHTGATAPAAARPASQRRLGGAPPLRVEIVGGPRRPSAARGLARWLARVAPRRARGAVTVAIVGEARMRTLNRTWRGVDRPTDVLAFPSGEPDGPLRGRRWGPSIPRPLGDIVIALDVARRQARRLGHPLATELRVLALHGLLHLVGYDHERDRGEMRRIERRLLRKGGLGGGLLARSAEDRR
jgi:probable rRNA maturation factor